MEGSSLAWSRDTAWAMSQENVEIVREGYERFAATGELEPDLATDDFVWDMSNFHGWPEQQTYEGVDGAESLPRQVDGSVGGLGARA